jgi:RHS repeat-associated protein
MLISTRQFHSLTRLNVRIWVRLVVAAALPFCCVAGAQQQPAVGAVDGNLQPPMAGGHDYVHLLAESVNPATGALSIRIQLPVPKGRGITPPAYWSYNSGELSSLIEPSGQVEWATAADNPAGKANGWGTPTSTPLYIGSSEWNFTSPEPPQGQSQVQNCNFASGYSFTDLNGTSHVLGVGGQALSNSYPPGQCGTHMVSTGQSDGQVWAQIDPNGQTELENGNAPGVSVMDLYGNTYGLNSTGIMEDHNGNYLSSNDTAGRPLVLQLPSTNGSFTVYGLTYTIATESISLNYQVAQQLTVSQNAANCGNTAVVGANSATITVISSISLPNGQKYQFQYDPTYGVIKEIDYPDGGKVTYSWQLGPTVGPSQYTSVASFPGVDSSGNGIDNACTVQYQTPVVTSRTVYFDGSNAAQSQTFTYSTTWNQTSWTSKSTQITTTDDKTGKNFLTSYTYSPTANNVATPFSDATNPDVPMEQTVSHYDWGSSSGALDTVTEAWYNQFQKACEVHTLNNGYSYGHYYSWTDGFISDDKEFDSNSVSNLAGYCTPTGFSTPTVTPTRETVTAFQQFTSPVPPGMTFGKPSSVVVYANGTKIAETDYLYDQFGLQSVSGLTNHDETHFSTSQVTGRGNITTLTRKCLNNGCSGDSITTFHYDETGQVISMTDPCGNSSCSDMPSGVSHTTTYSYADSYSSGTPPGTTNTYLTSVTDASGHADSYTYSYMQGDLTSHKDQNNNTTQYSYGTTPPNCSIQDKLDRLTEIQGPPDPNNSNQSSITSYCYSDTAPSPSVTTSELLNTSGQWKTSVAVMDGMGHTVQTQLTSDSSTDSVDMSYDGEGRPMTKSNPHRSTSAPTDGTTTYYYDAIGRMVAQQNPDGSWIKNCYNGVASATNLPSGISVPCNGHLGSSAADSWVDSTDENGNEWQRTTDFMGNLIEVMEPNGSSQTPSMQTDYGYLLNELVSVTQKGTGSGSRNRSFAYDSLGHLVAANNPENASAAVSARLTCSEVSGGPWTTCYGYDLNGNLISREDNRQVTETRQYDSLNRVTWRTFNDSVTPSYGYGYDGKDEWGNPLSSSSNAIGRLSAASNEVNAASHYSYDVMGRAIQRTECLPGDCSFDLPVNAGFYLDGSVKSMTNGLQQPITFSYGYDGAARLQSLTSNWTPDCNHPGTLFSSPAYTAVGLTGATLGAVNNGCPNSSTNIVTEARSYDNRLRITSESYQDSAAEVSAPSGSVSVSSSTGGEQSKTVGQSSGQGSFTISGSEQSTTIYVPCGPYGQTCPQTIWDSGPINVTVNGTVYNGGNGYGQFSTASGLASQIASEINGGPDTNATVSGSTIYLTARATGAATNYSISGYSATGNTSYFSGPSFTVNPSGSTMTGGSDGTVSYDTGTITVTVNGVNVQANWGQGDTVSSVASRVASNINGSAAGSFLTASPSGGQVTLTSKSESYWPVSVSYNGTNSNFPTPSFTATGSNMTPNNTNETAYSYSLGYDNVGNTNSVTDSIVGGWTYGYDTLNRLITTGQASGGPYANQYGCWTYDPFGNRTAEVFQTSPCSSTPATATYNSNNQVTWTSVNSATSGFTYDAAGNVTDDGSHTYLYDGAGRICAVQGDLNRGQMYGYVYDAEGDRVAKGTITTFSCNLSSNGFSATAQYIVGLGGEQLTELDGSNHWIHTNIFAGGALLATYANGDTDFALTDWQGTKRAQSGVGGCLTGWGTLPYGNGSMSNKDPMAVSIGNTPQCAVDATEHHYTDKVHDFESSNDDFGARYFEDATGRWLSPDWAAGAEDVPFASFDRPQTLNLYAFVANNPLSHVDVDGHVFYRVTCSDGVAGQCGVGHYPGSDGIFTADGMTYMSYVEGQENKQETFYDRWLTDAQNAAQNAGSNAGSASPQSEATREAHQRRLVISRTTELLGDKAKDFDIDASLGGCHLIGGNCEFHINDPELTAAVNSAMGDPNSTDPGSHSGAIHHDRNFHISLHHDHDALHVDHYNVTRDFPVGAALHGAVDVAIGTLFYGTTKAFAYR